MREHTLAALAMFAIAAPAWGVDARSGANLRLDLAADEGTSELQTAAARLDLDAALAFDTGWSLTALARIRVDREDRIEPGRPTQEERSRFNRRWLWGDSADAELRELYVDGHVGGTFVRIGKQQIVWGQADGLRVLDVVNPFSYREFIWPDPQDRRIPLWTVKSETPLGGAMLQLLWIADPTYDEIPAQEAAFAITTPLLIPQSRAPVPIAETRRPQESSTPVMQAHAFPDSLPGGI